MPTAAQALKFLGLNEIIDPDIKAALIDAFGDDDAARLAGSAPFDILDRISEALPTHEATWLDIATTMLDSLKRMVPGTTETVVSQAPQRIVVEQAKRLDEHGIAALLGMLVSGENDVDDVIAALTTKPDVQSAATKTDGKFIVLGDGGKIDVEATTAYIARLKRAFGQAEHDIDGRVPVTLNRALKRSEMVTINPLTDKIEYVGQRNQYGFVISDVPDELYAAVMWAANTGHPFMPKRTTDELDLITHHEQLFSPEGRRAARILMDYRAARDYGDLVALTTLPRQLTEEQARELLGSETRFTGDTAVGQPAAEPNWEDVVRQHFAGIAEFRSTSATITGYNKQVKGHFTSLKIAAYNVRVDAVVIDQMILTEYNIRGVVTMPPHCNIVDRGYNNNGLRVVNVTWKEIAELIGARP